MFQKMTMKKWVFCEMQTFMYAVMADHLKTDKGNSLVSQYEGKRDVQSFVPGVGEACIAFYICMAVR
jgi:hypothetical protein